MQNADKAKTGLALRELVFGAIIIALAAATLFITNGQSPRVTIEGDSISIEVVDDLAERRMGLSGRSSLAKGHGMLFVLDEPGLHGFWMKDMNFSIDILWLNANGAIVHMESDVSPESYPEIYYPSVPADYVLELTAGEAAANGYDIGDIVQIDI